MTRLTETERDRIRPLRNDGLTQNEIAERIGCSQATVSLELGSGRGMHFGHANGYEYVIEGFGDTPIYIHRLLAAVDHTLDELKDNQIHHKNDIEWDNRPENIEVVTVSEHRKIHDKA